VSFKTLLEMCPGRYIEGGMPVGTTCDLQPQGFGRAGGFFKEKKGRELEQVKILEGKPFEDQRVRNVRDTENFLGRTKA